MFQVYVLQNPVGKFYVGHTEELNVRLDSHNRTDKMGGKFTRKNGPWELVWTEEHFPFSGESDSMKDYFDRLRAPW